MVNRLNPTIKEYLEACPLEEIIENWCDVNKRTKLVNGILNNHSVWTYYHFKHSVDAFTSKKMRNIHEVILSIDQDISDDAYAVVTENKESKYGLDREFCKRIHREQIDDMEQFMKRKELIFNTIVDDEKLLKRCYSYVREENRREKFIEDRERNYLV